MIVDFGMRVPFRWDGRYVIPTGAIILRQWNELLEERLRYRNLTEIIGKFSDEVWNNFHKNYVVPLSEISYYSHSPVCHCYLADRAYAIGDDSEVAHEGPERFRVLTLFDIFDIVRHTDALPIFSPLFHRTKGFVGGDYSQRTLRCMCNALVQVIDIEPLPDSRYKAGYTALRRAPLDIFSRSFMTYGFSDGIRKFRESAIPDYIAKRAVARLARMELANGSPEIFLRAWDADNISRAYYGNLDRFRNRDDAAFVILLQMISGQHEHDSYPSYETITLFKDDVLLQRLVKNVSLVSFSSNVFDPRPFNFAEGRKRHQKYDQHRPTYSFKVIVRSTMEDIDMQLMASLHTEL